MKSGIASQTRSYRQGARAQAAAETHRRIVRAFLGHMQQRWFDEIRLEDVARDAEVTVQTVIRRFGNKEGLIEAATYQLSDEIQARRLHNPSEPRAALKSLVDDYELTGDLAIRILAQEPRHPALSKLLNFGRARHRAWVCEVFAPLIGKLPPPDRDRRVSALVAVTDVYTWKLLRRDLGHSPAETVEIMHDLASKFL